MRDLRFGAVLATILISVPAVAIVQLPPGPPTIGFLNGTELMLERTYSYRIGSTEVEIIIPVGFVTDFASVPAAAQGLFASQAQYSRAALIHDYLYWTQACTRMQADNLMMVAMRESRVPAWRRETIYRILRLAGGQAWKDNARQRGEGRPRVIPPTRVNLVNAYSWKEARAILRRDKVNDPSFAVDPAACQLGNTTRVP